MTRKEFEIRLFGRGIKVYRGENGSELIMTGTLIANLHLKFGTASDQMSATFA